jgi:hypothetical protein
VVVGPARAEETAALYQATWAGLPAGQIRLTLREGDGAYRNAVEIRSQGLARLVTRFRGSAATAGRLAAGAAPEPAHYAALYDLHWRRDRRLNMDFVQTDGGSLAERGAGDTSIKPVLAEQFRRNVMDPISALTAIRQALRRGVRNDFTVPVYDGARRFDVLVRILPQQSSAGPVVRLALTLRPIAGFKGETSDDGDPDTAPRPVALTLSDDAKLMPLSMRVSIWLLPLVVEFTQWCGSGEPCGW